MDMLQWQKLVLQLLPPQPMQTQPMVRVKPGAKLHQVEEPRPAARTNEALHQVCYVQTQAAERCRRRVARQLREIPTAQWIAENIPASDDEDSGGSLRCTSRVSGTAGL